jgi:hypothetical protein
MYRFLTVPLQGSPNTPLLAPILAEFFPTKASAQIRVLLRAWQPPNVKLPQEPEEVP